MRGRGSSRGWGDECVCEEGARKSSDEGSLFFLEVVGVVLWAAFLTVTHRF